MDRTIRLHLVEAFVSAVADLQEERAPKTCEMLWKRLPLEGRTVHGMYSGPEIFIRTSELPDVQPENQVHRALPGDVGYWIQEGGRVHSSPERMAEVLLIYGRGAAIMGPDGQPTWVNLFARMRDAGSEDFYRAARRVREDGPLTLRITRDAG